MKIGVIGGTGKEGHGLSLRWAKAGHDVAVGSRDAERGHAKAVELTALSGRTLVGGGNEFAASWGEVAVLCVPYAAHGDTLRGLVASLAGRILIDITVPLLPPKVRLVNVPAGGSAAREAQVIVGPDVKVVAALHHVHSAHLSSGSPGEAQHAIDCDVLACSDDQVALDSALGLIRELGLRAFDAGPLQNAVALESLTPVLLHLNKRYKSPGAGIRFTGLPDA